MAVCSEICSIDSKTIEFNYSIVSKLSKNTSFSILSNISSYKDWLFINKSSNEMSHKSSHSGLQCNDFKSNIMMFHIQPSGYYADIFIPTKIFMSSNEIVFDFLPINQPGIDKVSDFYLKVSVYDFGYKSKIYIYGKISSPFNIGNGLLNRIAVDKINMLKSNFEKKVNP